jgi:AbrB family looped-hinge helix DNA binding protein
MNGTNYANMKCTPAIDKAGRVRLPKPARHALHINPGDSLKLESSNDHIVLRPARRKARLYKKQGIWVCGSISGVPLSAETVNRTISRVRAERERRVLGKFKG